jgi:hypothetical protein
MAHLVIANFLLRSGRQQGYPDAGIVGKSRLHFGF